MRLLKPISQAFLIPIPVIPDGSFNFTFTATVNKVQYPVVFKFYEDVWHVWFTFPDTSVRRAGVFSGDISWSGYEDFGLYVFSTLDSIGQNDLGNVAFYFLVWS